jgi:hypothetical protein
MHGGLKRQPAYSGHLAVIQGGLRPPLRAALRHRQLAFQYHKAGNHSLPSAPAHANLSLRTQL